MAVYEYVVNTGAIVPNTVDIRTSIENEYLALFGSTLSLSPSSPQGLLITAETTSRDAVARNNAQLANQINPNLAGGIYLDAIGALTQTVRKPNGYSTISNVIVTGVPNTTLPQGSIAQTTLGFSFQTVLSVNFDALGNAVVDFIALDFGAIPADPNTLTTIAAGSVLNWETVTNPNAAMTGELQETDEAFRRNRKNRLGMQGMGQAEAVISQLSALPGVIDVLYRENTSDVTQVIDNVTMISHSLYVCVDGGLDSEIASTLSAVKNAGCGYNGAVTYNYVEPISGQTIPVQFDRPTLVPVATRVTVRATSVSSVPDPTATIIKAIIAYSVGLIPGESGLKLGVPVSPFEFSGAINYYAPQIFVQKVEVAYTSTLVYTTVSLPIEVFQKATISPSFIDVVYI